MNIHLHLITEPWCAKIYASSYHNGNVYKLFETDQGSLSETPFDNEASSFKVREGCTLQGFDDDDLNNPIFDITTDIGWDETINDKLTGYICKCERKFFYCKILRLFCLLRS